MFQFRHKDKKKNPNPKIYTDFWDCNPKILYDFWD